MAKLPSLIVPVTIDSSGVDRGISNVNNKLRRGSGRFGVGGGGFGTGGGNGSTSITGMLVGSAVAGIGGYGAYKLGQFRDSNDKKLIGRHLREDIRRSKIMENMATNLDKRKAYVYGNYSRAYGKDIKDTVSDGVDGLGLEQSELLSFLDRRQSRLRSIVSRGMYKSKLGALGPLGEIAGKLSPMALKFGIAGAAVGALGRKMSTFDQDVAGMSLKGFRGGDMMQLMAMRARAKANIRGDGMSNFMLGTRERWGKPLGTGDQSFVESFMRGGGDIITKNTPTSLGRIAEAPISGTIETIFRAAMYAMTPTYGATSKQRMYEANLVALKRSFS